MEAVVGRGVLLGMKGQVMVDGTGSVGRGPLLGDHGGASTKLVQLLVAIEHDGWGLL
jgi:hypothetical protein